MKVGSWFKNSFATDMHSMMEYFNQGTFVADVTKQLEVFNHVPEPEEAVSEYLASIHVPLL